MKRKFFFLLISVVCLLPVSPTRAEEGAGQPKDTPYPEEKYYEMDCSVMNKAKEGLESLYMKTPPPTEGVDLEKIDKTFFREGTVGHKEKDYLKEAGKNRWEEWPPVFFEFGKVLKKQGKQIYHEWFFPDQKRKK
ncbi:MAG: hypothetical protein U9Q24_02780 [Candidatus Ratteibacteria bacterium]|nr:hypothetical protein [Candidatus Ratteibacteria bacterium]